MSSTLTPVSVKHFLVQFITTVTLAFISSQAVLGQTIPTGSLSGSVTDSHGAVVPNATVVVTNLATNTEFTVQTSDNGTFTVASLVTGLYSATITAPNFKKTIVRDIKIDVGKTTNLNAALEVGQVTESVIIQGGAEVLQTTDTSVSSTITGRQINELPFATRDALQLVLVQPGTQTATVPRASSINGLPKGSL